LNADLLDLYTDYLISSFGQTTATGLSEMLTGQYSHDAITRFLSNREYTSKDLWLSVKTTVRTVESDRGVLIFDDTIQEKKWSEENEVICWHYDHCVGRNVKGFNILNALYHNDDVSIPVAFEIIRKPLIFCEVETRRTKRRSEVTKNELMRSMLANCITNQLKFTYVLMDSWFSAKENFEFIVARKKHFVAALKDNRLVALSEDDKKQGRFVRIDSLELSDRQAVRGWLKGYDQEVLLVRRIFTHKDGNTVTLSLVCSDLTLDGDQVAAIYQKRWKVEEFHKSLKSNAAMAKSPVHRPMTQNNHIFATIYAVFKLECLKIKHNLNHFALKSKIYMKALRNAFGELQALRSA
jgi:DDE superfamily endonuclease